MIIVLASACRRDEQKADALPAPSSETAVPAEPGSASGTAGESDAKQWEYVYLCGPASGYGPAVIRCAEDGGYVVAGDTSPSDPDDSDFLILKLDADGQVQWQESFGGIYRESIASIEQTEDGGYIVAGSSQSFRTAKGDVWLIRLDADGKPIWQKTYGGDGADEASCAIPAGDGGFIVSGSTRSFGAGEFDFWLFKTDESGEVIWQKSYGGDRNDRASCIARTDDGGYIAAGTIEVVARRFVVTDVLVMKLDAEGGVLWQKAYGGEDNDGADSIRQTGDGGYIIAGYAVYGTGLRDAWVFKLKGNGGVEWQKSFGGRLGNTASCIRQTDEGGYIVAGYTEAFGAGDEDAWLLKLDAYGEAGWQKCYGGKAGDSATSVEQVDSGGYIAAGYTESYGAGGPNIWVVKLAASGTYEDSELVTDTYARANSTSAASWDTDISIKTTDAMPKTTSDPGTEAHAIPKEHGASLH